MIPGIERQAPERVAVQLRRALIVDEALPVRRKLLDILYRAGMEASDVQMATSAEIALEKFAREHPSIVLTELVGDSDAGLDMVLEMLTLDPQVRIVLVTAEDPRSPMVRKAIRAGVFAVIEKPVRNEAIRTLLSEIDAEDGGIERFR